MNEHATLEVRLAQLRAAVSAAHSIGLESEAAAAEAVAERIAERAGFGGATYVVALAGGTGVGKSSLLNALAGREVSTVRAIRPTTDRPLAFVAEEHREEVGPLLEWLGVQQVVTDRDPTLGGVALLDLPDMDSVRRDHRATVDALLPRIDAVWWVVDPEKYDDERGHGYWRSLTAHSERMRFILNKADRLSDPDGNLVADDLRRRLLADGLEHPVVRVVSAHSGLGVVELRRELGRAAEAKAAVTAKLEVDRARAAAELARAVGVDPAGRYAPLLAPARRDAGIREAVEGALALIDPPGVGRQVQAAVLFRARVRGGSVLGRAVALLNWMTGNRRRRADPAAYLAGWRSRGALGRALNPVRAMLVDAVGHVPPASRGRLLEAVGAPAAEAAVERALDEAAAREAARLEVRSSPVWLVIGAAQLVVGGVFLFAVAWYVTLFLVGGTVAVATVEAPLLGPIPMPLALLVASVAASALLGWLLTLHAGWVGRRLTGQVRERIRTDVHHAIAGLALAGLGRVEDARERVAEAVY